MDTADLRVCFIGDSYVAGFGDREHLGWVGRVAAQSAHDGRLLTAYNLGIRRQTSADVVQRWRPECTPRLPAHCEGRIVVSFGVNDMTTDDDGHVRVAPAASADNLARLVNEMRTDYAVLVVGPPPLDDPAHNERTAALCERYAAVCRDYGVHYVGVFSTLLADRCWMEEVAADDGAHPGAAGYQRLANLIYPGFASWLAESPVDSAAGRYLGEVQADGTVVLHPATVMTAAQAQLRRRPDISAAIDSLAADPAAGIRRGRPRRRTEK